MMMIIVINDDDDDCDDDTYQVKGLGWHEMSCLGSEQVLTGIRTFWWGNAVFLRPCSFTRTPCHGNRFSSILCADLGHGLWKKWKSQLWVWYQLRETWFQQVLPRNSYSMVHISTCDYTCMICVLIMCIYVFGGHDICMILLEITNMLDFFLQSLQLQVGWWTARSESLHLGVPKDSNKHVLSSDFCTFSHLHIFSLTVAAFVRKLEIWLLNSLGWSLRQWKPTLMRCQTKLQAVPNPRET